MKTLGKIFTALGFAVVASSASAATVTAQFDVTANVAAACTVTASNLAFGPYNPINSTAVTGSTTILVTCTNQTPYTYDVPTPTARSMAGSGTATGASLNYGLYNEVGLTSGFGITTPAAGSGSAQTINVYGRIPASQTLALVGNYSDTVTVTVRY